MRLSAERNRLDRSLNTVEQELQESQQQILMLQVTRTALTARAESLLSPWKPVTDSLIVIFGMLLNVMSILGELIYPFFNTINCKHQIINGIYRYIQYITQTSCYSVYK